MWPYRYRLGAVTRTHARKNFVIVSGQRKIGEIIMKNGQMRNINQSLVDISSRLYFRIFLSLSALLCLDKLMKRMWKK